MPVGEKIMSEPLQLSKKIVLLGDPSVGKTSVARKFVYDIFDDIYISTLGTKVSKKLVVFENVFNTPKIELTLLVWDVMGQHDFVDYHKVAFTGCKGALIVCDITRTETIENWYYWQKSIYRSEGEVPFIIIGNKFDLAKKHQAGVELFNDIVKGIKVPSFLTSAKTGENIEKAFSILGANILEKHFQE